MHIIISSCCIIGEYAVAQLVETLRCNPAFTFARMALGSTQPLTEKSTRGISLGAGVKGGLTTLPPSCADCLEILGASTAWGSKGL
jgi:hypothetical protein